MDRRTVLILSLMCVVELASTASAAPGDVEAVIMAAPAEVSRDWKSPGHAFICIRRHLNSGIKEDCYGFYPREDGAGMFVGTPGAVKNEFVRAPERFSKIAWEAKRLVTEEQVRAFLKLVDEANRKEYDLLDSNCHQYAADAAKRLGFKEIEKNLFPAKYVRNLYLAETEEFDFQGGTFRRSGEGMWSEFKGENLPATARATFDFEQKDVDDEFVYLYDSSRRMELRLPLKGGMSSWRTPQDFDWNELYEVTPKSRP